MAGPIYKLFLMKPLPTWFELSEEERNAIVAKDQENFERVGGEIVFRGTSIWSSEQWALFGVLKFPDIEAVQAHAAYDLELNWPYQYFETMTILGTEWEPE